MQERTRSKLKGMFFLGSGALGCLDGQALARSHLLRKGNADMASSLSGACRSLEGSDDLANLAKWRLANVYQSGSWSTFWKQRSGIGAVAAALPDKKFATAESDFLAALSQSLSR